MDAQLSFLPEPQDPPESQDSDENYTPREVFLPLHREFEFNLDPCATPESAKCAVFYTKEQNGLSLPWGRIDRFRKEPPRRVWLNPPYSNIGIWLAKARAEMGACNVSLVVALLPAWTDRRWWHEFVEPYRDCNVDPSDSRACEVRFLKGRVAFGAPGNPNGVGRGGGKFPSVLVIWREPSTRGY